jgi:hypothetical protein
LDGKAKTSNLFEIYNLPEFPFIKGVGRIAIRPYKIYNPPESPFIKGGLWGINGWFLSS